MIFQIVYILKKLLLNVSKFWNFKLHNAKSFGNLERLQALVISMFFKKKSSSQLHKFCLPMNTTSSFGGKWDIVGTNVWWILLCKLKYLTQDCFWQKHICWNFLLKSFSLIANNTNLLRTIHCILKFINAN
jgi:hypothetical protein